MRITKLILAIVIASITFASCQKKDDLTTAIPADATYVVNIDTKTLIEKSNYDIFQNVIVTRGINMAKAMLNKKEAVDMLEAFSKDANALGINLKSDCYMYYDESVFGLILGVNDAEKIKNLFEHFALAQEGDIKIEDGVYTLTPTSDFVLGWNKDKFLFITQANPQRYYHKEDNEDIDLVALAKKQLTQDAKESINSNPAFAKFLSGKKDISAFYTYSTKNFELLEKMAGIDMPEEFLNEMKELKGINTMAYISFEKGEIKTDAKVIYNDSETEKKYKELNDQICGTIKGDHLKYISENPIFLTAFNLNGKGIYDYLEKIKITKYIDENDEEGIFKSVMNDLNGDVTIALSNILSVKKSYSYGGDKTYEYDSTEPEYALFAESKNGNGVIELIKEKIVSSNDDIKEIDATTFAYNKDGLNQYFGVKNNTVFLTNSETVFNNIQSQSGNSNLYADLTKNNFFMMTGNIQSLREVASEKISEKEIATVVNNLINMFGTYSYTANKEAGQGKIEMTDKSQNSFAVICKFVDDVLTVANDQVRF